MNNEYQEGESSQQSSTVKINRGSRAAATKLNPRKEPIDSNGRLFKCSHPNCRQKFLNQSDLVLHKKDHQSRVSQNQFRCDICGMNTKADDALAEHKKLHVDQPALECVLCKKMFKKRGALVRHMRIHNDEKFYQCDKCGKEFIHKSSFQMHIMAHDNIREKQCPHCALQFRSSSHLNRHLRIHVSAMAKKI